MREKNLSAIVVCFTIIRHNITGAECFTSFVWKQWFVIYINTNFLSLFLSIPLSTVSAVHFHVKTRASAWWVCINNSLWIDEQTNFPKYRQEEKKSSVKNENERRKARKTTIKRSPPVDFRRRVSRLFTSFGNCVSVLRMNLNGKKFFCRAALAKRKTWNVSDT